jgi:hypothetical protein
MGCSADVEPIVFRREVSEPDGWNPTAQRNPAFFFRIFSQMLSHRVMTVSRD